MPGTEPEPKVTGGAYRDVLERHGFTDDPATGRFHAPDGRVVVAVTDTETPSANIAAPVADSTQRYRWEIHLHGVPAGILDATLDAATTGA